MLRVFCLLFIGLLVRIKQDSFITDMANATEYMVTLTVLKEIHINTQRCRGFMPGIISGERYDVNIVSKIKNGRPCPFVEKSFTYIVTATCDPQQDNLRVNQHSLFRKLTDNAEWNLRRRCNWN